MTDPCERPGGGSARGSGEGRRASWRAVGNRRLAVAAAAVAALAAAIPAPAMPVPRPPGIPWTGSDWPALAVAEAESALARADRALVRGETDLALRLYSEIPPAPGAAARARCGEARCWLALGRAERALDALKAGVALADSTTAGREVAASATELLGQTLLRMGRPDRARAAFEELARRWPERRDWAAVMIGRVWHGEESYRAALDAIRPQLREGRYAPAYDLALSLYWKLDGSARRDLDRLLQNYLRTAGRGFGGDAGR